MYKKLLRVIAIAVVVGGMSVPAGAVSTGNDDNVTICHRTNAVKNPYVQITVDKNAVDGAAGNSGGQPDHFGEHKGPIATSEAVAQGYKDAKVEWGDIIPPVPGFHGGFNWTAEGQAIYNNGCNYVTPGSGGGGNNGGGGGSTLGTNNPTTPQTGTTPQVVSTPVAGVDAGAGGTAGTTVPSLVVLLGSILISGYGLYRLRIING